MTDDTGVVLRENNEKIVRLMSLLKKQRAEMSFLIEKQETEKGRIQNEIEKLSFKLTLLTKSLMQRMVARTNYDKTIKEIEERYSVLVNESGKLLQNISKEYRQLEEIMDKKIGTVQPVQNERPSLQNEKPTQIPRSKEQLPVPTPEVEQEDEETTEQEKTEEKPPPGTTNFELLDLHEKFPFKMLDERSELSKKFAETSREKLRSSDDSLTREKPRRSTDSAREKSRTSDSSPREKPRTSDDASREKPRTSDPSSREKPVANVVDSSPREKPRTIDDPSRETSKTDETSIAKLRQSMAVQDRKHSLQEKMQVQKSSIDENGGKVRKTSKPSVSEAMVEKQKNWKSVSDTESMNPSPEASLRRRSGISEGQTPDSSSTDDENDKVSKNQPPSRVSSSSILESFVEAQKNKAKDDEVQSFRVAYERAHSASRAPSRSPSGYRKN